MRLSFDAIVMGLVFLIPNRVAFSVWFFAVFSWIFSTYMTQYRLAVPQGNMYGNEIMHLAAGAAIAFVGWSLWTSRTHLRRALRCAFGRGDSAYDAGEPTSYRTAFGLIGAGTVISIVWLRVFGLNIFQAVLLILVTLVVYYAMARIIAQCGLPVLSPAIMPSKFVTTLFGAGNLQKQDVTVMAMHYGWHFDVRNSPMSAAAHGSYLARGNRSGLLWAMLLGLVIAFATAAMTTVRVSYRYGGLNMDGWFFNVFPRYTVWPWAHSVIIGTQGPSYALLTWATAGGVLMLLLAIAHHSYFWWPLHPVGLLVCSSHMVRYFWISVFVAWSLKLLVVKFGGNGAYRVARRFVVGGLMGYFLAGGLWAILDTLTGMQTNQILAI
jgi:hypothetical protein